MKILERRILEQVEIFTVRKGTHFLLESDIKFHVLQRLSHNRFDILSGFTKFIRINQTNGFPVDGLVPIQKNDFRIVESGSISIGLSKAAVLRWEIFVRYGIAIQ